MARRHKRQEGPLLDQLRREGLVRWVLLVIAFLLLAWFFGFAGKARHAGQVKRRWAVRASRILVLASGALLARLLLLSHEERVPVIYFRARDAEVLNTHLPSIIDLRSKGYEIIPLDDVVMFIRERRYVPRKCLALVVGVASLADLHDVLELSRDTDVTVLLPLRALQGYSQRADTFQLPKRTTLGVAFTGREGTVVGDRQLFKEHLQSFADLAGNLLCAKPSYACLIGHSGEDLRDTLRATGYTCFLDGRGYNRFGDEPHLIRLMDVSDLTGSRRALTLRAGIYTALFKGKYIYWVPSAIDRMVRELSRNV